MTIPISLPVYQQTNSVPLSLNQQKQIIREENDVPEGPITIRVAPYDWIPDDKAAANEFCMFRAWALTEKDERVLLRFENFPNFTYIGLPFTVNNRPFIWSENTAATLFEWICKTVGPQFAPLNYKLVNKEKLYYYNPMINRETGQFERKQFPQLIMFYKNIASMYKVRELFFKANKAQVQNVEGIGEMQAEMYEDNVSLLNKMMVVKGVNLTSWMSVSVKKVQPDMRITKAHCVDHEYIADSTTLKLVPIEEAKYLEVHPRILAIDLEVDSETGAFPEPKNFPDHIRMIQCVWFEEGRPNVRHKVVFMYGEVSRKFPGAEIRRYDTELECLKAFCEYYEKEVNPEAMVGWNTSGFDLRYLFIRFAVYGEEFPNCSRLLHSKIDLKKLSWESSAYGKNDIYNILLEGCINIDLMLIVKRSYKLLKYDLGSVSQHFLDKDKHDVTAKFMFTTFKMQKKLIKERNLLLEQLQSRNSKILEGLSRTNQMAQIEDLMKNLNIQGGMRSIINNQYQFIEHYLNLALNQDATKEERMKARELVSAMNFQLLKVRDMFEGCTTSFRSIVAEASQSYPTLETDLKEFSEITTKLLKVMDMLADVTKDMEKIVDYGIQDSDLVIDLFIRLKIWTSLIEESSIAGVTPVELFTRGQQIRGLNQLYRTAYRRGFVVDRRPFNKMEYKGAFVYDPKAGKYKNLLCFDFASLYPSLIRQFNLCYTTLVHPRLMDVIPDELCYVIEWTEEEDEAFQVDDGVHPDDYDDEDFKKPKIEKGKHFKFKFLKTPEGVLPETIRVFLEARAKTRNTMKPLEKKLKTQEEIETEMYLIEKRLTTLSEHRKQAQEKSKLGGKYLKEHHEIVEKMVALGTELKYNERYLELLKKEEDLTINIEEMIELVEFDEETYASMTTRIRELEEKLRDNKITRAERLELDRLDKRQNGFKVSANSMYGLTGVGEGGVLPCIEIAMCTTAMGRMMIGLVNSILMEMGGEIVYNDTDSSFVNMHIQDPLECVKTGQRLQYEVTAKVNQHFLSKYRHRFGGRDATVTFEHIFTEDGKYKDTKFTCIEHRGDQINKVPIFDGGVLDSQTGDVTYIVMMSSLPIKLEFEKPIAVMLCLKKKFYAAILLDDKGNPKMNPKDILIKGIPLARRDKCKWMKKIYRRVLMNVLTDVPLEETARYIQEEIYNLMSRGVMFNDLVFTRAMGSNYKNASYPIKIFGDEQRRKGNLIADSERFDYMILDIGIPGEKMGFKMQIPVKYTEWDDEENAEKIVMYDEDSETREINVEVAKLERELLALKIDQEVNKVEQTNEPKFTGFRSSGLLSNKLQHQILDATIDHTRQLYLQYNEEISNTYKTEKQRDLARERVKNLEYEIAEFGRSIYTLQNPTWKDNNPYKFDQNMTVERIVTDREMAKEVIQVVIPKTLTSIHQFKHVPLKALMFRGMFIESLVTETSTQISCKVKKEVPPLLKNLEKLSVELTNLKYAKERTESSNRELSDEQVKEKVELEVKECINRRKVLNESNKPKLRPVLRLPEQDPRYEKWEVDFKYYITNVLEKQTSLLFSVGYNKELEELDAKYEDFSRQRTILYTEITSSYIKQIVKRVEKKAEILEELRSIKPGKWEKEQYIGPQHPGQENLILTRDATGLLKCFEKNGERLDEIICAEHMYRDPNGSLYNIVMINRFKPGDFVDHRGKRLPVQVFRKIMEFRETRKKDIEKKKRKKIQDERKKKEEEFYQSHPYNWLYKVSSEPQFMAQMARLYESDLITYLKVIAERDPISYAVYYRGIAKGEYDGPQSSGQTSILPSA